MHRVPHRSPPLVPLLLLAGLLPAAPAAAQSYTVSPAGVAAFNAEVQGIYDGLRPTIERELQQQARAQLDGFKQVEGKWEIEVEKFHALRLKVDAAPGLLSASSRALQVAVPARGTWEIEVEADVRIRKTSGWPKPRIRLRHVRVNVSEVRLTAGVELDDTDPYRPTAKRVGTPKFEARVRLRSKRLFTGLLMRILSPFANKLARKAVDEALAGLTPQLSALQGLPGEVPADGAPLLTDSGAPLPWDEVVTNVGEKQRAHHLPHGTLLHARSDVPTEGSWLDDYRDGGAGNVGTSVPVGDGGDSAIWTGHYLAGEAFRYGVTQDPVALDNVRHAIRGISALLEVHGQTGLLARVAAPASSPMGASILADGRPTVLRSMRGEVWVGTNGSYGISRDQYMGVFMGLALAYDLVPDSAVRAECRLRVEQMVDYLMRTGWWVDEDRPALGLSTPQGKNGFPTFWGPGIDQKLNTLLIGQRVVATTKYDAEIARITPLAETDWLSSWSSCFSYDSYYKFNLAHGTYYNYFRLETDPARRAHLERGYLITRRYVGHHRNPHFELVQASILPAERPRLFPAAKEGLRRFLLRPHRHVAPTVVDLSGVTFVTIDLPVIPAPGQSNATTASVTIPSEPLEPLLRKPGGDFLWQRNPFEVAQAGKGDPHRELPGIDLTLPYWMGRYHGAW